MLALVCGYSPKCHPSTPAQLINTSRTVKRSKLKDLRAKNYQGSQDEWSQIVSYVLGQLPPSASKEDWAAGLETSANITGSGGENQELNLSIRKRIETITVCAHCPGNDTPWLTSL